MHQKICYRIDGLLELLPNFHVKKLSLTDSYEDDSNIRTAFFLVSREDILYVEKFYGLWTSQNVHFKDGSKINLKSNNVNRDDKTLLRINKNTIISPVLNLSDNYVQSTEDFREWLEFNGVSNDDLENIIECFDVSTIIEYVGVPTPNKMHSSWAYSSENLKLEEKEINEVLNGINDELLRKKIECILYARVFKKYY